LRAADLKAGLSRASKRVVTGRFHRIAWVGFVLALALVAAGFMVGPRTPVAMQSFYCVGNVDLPGPFGFGLNCDGPLFMTLAREPQALLARDCSRQTRPGLIVMAAVLHAPLQRFANPDRPLARFPANLFTRNPAHIAEAFRVDFPAYVAYITLNFAFLFGVFACLLAVLRPLQRMDAPTTLIVLALGVLLIANDVTKAFLWAPHTQLLNILGPMVAIYCARRVRDGALERTRFALGIGALLGLAMTVYGVFAIVVAAVGVAALLSIAHRHTVRVALPTLLNLVILVALTALPSMLWYRYVVHKTGQFYNIEFTVMRQVVWMKDSWRIGAGHFALEWLNKLLSLLKYCAPQAIPALGIAVVTGFFAIESRGVAAALRRAAVNARLSILVCVAVAGFFACVGLINERLAFAIVPGLIVWAGSTALGLASAVSRRRRWFLALSCFGVAVAAAVYAIVKRGPYA